MNLVLLFSVTVLSIIAARWLAITRGRSARGWMIAAAVLGPLPLLPLACLKRPATRPRS